ncbi:MAG: helicase HerA domain-containing protein [Thermoplasmata archaeon]|jgi:energy-coupling factor transporter ATP-binding protein EcfA2
MWRNIHEYINDGEIYKILIPIDPGRERQRHLELSGLFFSFIRKTGRNIRIIFLVDDGSPSLYVSMDGGIETLNTVYGGLVFSRVDAIDVKGYDKTYIFKSRGKGARVRERSSFIDFFEYILEYSYSLEKPSFLLIFELKPTVMNPDLFAFRIVAAFKSGDVKSDLISLISNLWSGDSNIYARSGRFIFGKTGFMDEKSSSLLLPFPGNKLEKSGIGIRSQGITSSRNMLKSVSVGKSIRNSTPCTIDFFENEGQSMLILGETGSGKSTLMLTLFKNLSSLNLPILVLDPTGDTVERMLDVIDDSTAERLIYISPAESPVSMNLLELPGYIDRRIAVSRLAEDIIQVLRNVTEAESGVQGGLVGSRIEEIMRHSINGLIGIKGSTLLDIYDIITRQDVRRNFMKISENEDFKDFLSNLENFTPDDISSTRRTLSFIKANKILSSMVCSRKPSFSIYDAIRENKIILVSGDRGKVSEKVSTFILSTMLSMFWISLQSREGKKPVFLFCDEFQEYENSSFQDMLILGRKENLNLFMATTHLSTVPEGLRDNIMANTKNYALFKLSPSDALDFSIKFTIEKDKLQFLGRGVAYIRSRGFSDYAAIEFHEKSHGRKEYLKKRFYRVDDHSQDDLILDLRLLYHLHLEPTRQNLKSIGDRILDERDIDTSIEDLKKRGKISIVDGRIEIRDDMFRDRNGRIIDKLLSMGNVVRLESTDPLVLRCLPVVPNLMQGEFFVYLDPTTDLDGIKIYSQGKRDCKNCYSLDEFLSLDTNGRILMDIGGILSGTDGDLLVTTSRRIANALREYSDYYRNFQDLERVVRKALLDSGLGRDGERKVIGKERVKTLIIDLKYMREKFTPYNFKPSESLKIEE